MLPLPKLISPGGPRLLLMRNGLVEKHKIEQADLFKVSTMMQDILLLEDDNLAVSGAMAVQDMSDMSIAFVKSLSISLTKKAMTCFQHGYPNRIKGGHFFNISGVFDVMYNLFKPFLTEKLKRRVSFLC